MIKNDGMVRAAAERTSGTQGEVYRMPNIHLVEFPGPALEIIRNPVLRCVGRCSNIPAYSIDRHSHPTVELIYIVSGHGFVEVGGSRYPLEPGTIAVYNPGVQHAERFGHEEEAPLFYHLKFDELSISGMPVNCLLPAGLLPTFPSKENGASFDKLLSTMFQEAEQQSLGYRQILDHLLYSVLLLTLRILDSHYVQLRKKDAGSLVYQIQQYFAQNFSQKLSMKEIADQFHINGCYLSHLFKESIGLSPSAYLTEFRINEACRLLSQTDLPIHQIASDVGYANQSNFQIQFKKSKGMSPLQYRAYYVKNPLKHVDDGYPDA